MTTNDPARAASTLILALGPTMVQAMTGTPDRDTVLSWAEGTEPPADTQAQLNLGYQVWTIVSREEGPRTAAAWLTGSDPHLNDCTPITAIRELRSADVIGAAEGFINT